MPSCRSKRFWARRSPGAPTGRTSSEQLFARYVEAKQSHAVLDYDDLLLYWAHAATEPSIGAEMGEKFDHVLIDEYQDTNRLQAAILSAMKPNGEGVTVVGDDAQSIYAFRAATVRNILDFPSGLRHAGARRDARAELSLDPADPFGRKCRHRAGGRAVHQEPLVGSRDRRRNPNWCRSRTIAVRRTAWSNRFWRTAKSACG